MVTEELGLLLKGHRFHGDQAHMIPNRSGSATKFGRGELEDDRSPRQALDNWAENSPAFMSGQKTAVVGWHKSLVDLIQEDFLRTPSPVNNQSRSSSHATTDEPTDHDAHAITLDVSAINLSEVPGSSDFADVCDSHDIALISKNDSLATSLSSSTGPDGAGSSQNSRIDDTNTKTADWRMMCQLLLPLIQREFRKKHSHGHAKFFSIAGQTSMHSPGLTIPLYVTTGAYMPSGNPFYPNFQPSGVYAPHYNVGGSALNSAFLPPFVAGNPPHGPVPMPFDATSGLSFNIQITGVSTAESIPHMGNLQHQKFYGHRVMMLQPSFVKPLQMQYFQHPFGNAYSASVQYRRLPSSNGIPNPRKLGISVGGYYGGPPGMGVIAQFPIPPISSPVLASLPVGGTSHPGLRNDLSYPQGSHRNTGIYLGWQGQRGVNIFDDPKRHSFLEELKSSNAQKFELSDIVGHIVEFRLCSLLTEAGAQQCEDKVSVFKEVLPHASKLMTDVLYIKKRNPQGSDGIVRAILLIALEVIELDQKTQPVLELDGHVMRCVRDQNGNHVIQKCTESVPTEKIGFIISAFQGQVAMLSTHPYGCRVFQRVLEHCSNEQQGQCMVDETLESAYVLAQDQYGNYITQLSLAFTTELIYFVK
ncbi:hypothetical protein Patl1_35230 [Pistacia atlantica]|uniref:Uncharacterized protein n=1 Tax=Pistacia atlantica TaxID=434234 RepID=A0ACC0ZPF8_9ROSI|nr:hypothetical protein Patl1_35230 [Pistacia atlantica]